MCLLGQILVIILVLSQLTHASACNSAVQICRSTSRSIFGAGVDDRSDGHRSRICPSKTAFLSCCWVNHATVNSHLPSCLVRVPSGVLDSMRSADQAELGWRAKTALVLTRSSVGTRTSHGDMDCVKTTRLFRV